MADIGRPTKYKPSMCQEAYDVLSQGGSLAKVCVTIDITVETMYQWRRSNQSFSEAIKRGLLASQVVWEENPPEMSDARYIFNLKNRFGWSDRQTDRSQQYSEEFNREGISKMMSTGEMSVDTGIKLLELLFKEDEINRGDAPINVNIVVKEVD